MKVSAPMASEKNMFNAVSGSSYFWVQVGEGICTANKTYVSFWRILCYNEFRRFRKL